MAEQHEELRLALVMNGGVSLAVWMGGVTNEIFRVVTQQHPVYAALLDMTRTTARVDVISGTSAGGVNGAALSMALLYGGDFSRLREVWLNTGAFSALLRPPLGDDPSALLMGDAFFLPRIIEALGSLAPEAQPLFGPQEMPIDLRLTTTLLRGQQGHSVDDLGTPIHDVDYRGQFRFRHTPDQQDFAQREQVIRQLGRAARSTASFPFAFEPSAVDPARAGLFDSQDQPLAPDDALPDGTQAARYVIDGGVLNNKPFRGALRSIFAMPAQRGVRRVLAYINPDPGDGPPGQPIKDAPPLSSVLGASLFGIPQSQSIADQLADIQDHNDKVRARRNSVVTTVLSLNPATLDALPEQLFAVYRRRRLASTFEGFVYEELPAASRRRSLDAIGTIVGRRGRDHLLATFMRVPWQGWIPQTWPTPAAPDAGCRLIDWEWGLYPVEFAIKLMLDLLRRTQQLCDFEPATQAPPNAAQQAAPQARTQRVQEPDWGDSPRPVAQAPDPAGWMAQIRRGLRGMMAVGRTDVGASTWDPESVRQAAQPTAEPHLAWLMDAWHDAYRCVERAQGIRAREQPVWERNADRLLALLSGSGPAGTSGVDRVTEDVFEDLFAFLITPARKARCGALALRVAIILHAVAEPALALAARVREKPSLRAHDREAAEQLAQVFGWLVSDGPGTPVCRIVRRLMQLEVIEFAHNDHEDLQADTLIELAQISGNSASPLDGATQAKDKLLGLQLAHFGAFYKQSWRANDWTYGRLDGSERMVKILLNPERLQRFFQDAHAAMRRIQAIALDDIASPVLHRAVAQLWVDRKYAPRVLRELAFLDDPRAAVPDALPVCTEVITLRLHFGILREEIDPLLAAIAVDRSQGADAIGASHAFVQLFAREMDADGQRVQPFSPEKAHQALKGRLIARETLVDEAGSDLFTRTLAHTSATLQAVLASKSAKLGPVSLFFASLKLPILGFYFVVRGLTRQSRTSAALHGGILAVGLVLVFVQLLLSPQPEKSQLPSPLLAFGWAMLAYGLLFSIVSAPRLISLVTLAAAVVLWAVAATGVYPQAQPWAIRLTVCAAIGGLLWLSVRFKLLACAQWLLGFVAIMAAALWSAGWRGTWPPPWSRDEPVQMLAALVCVVLLLAIWQASIGSRKVEAQLRRVWRWLMDL